MPLELVNTIWNELKRFIPETDMSEAAEIVVSSMIDHDYDIDDIRSAFRGEKEIKAALEAYSDIEEDIEEEYDDYEEDEDY